LNRTFRAEKVHGEEKLATTACLSMQYFGFYAQALHGVTCLQITATGKTRTVASAAGATKEYGRLFWNDWSPRLILNG
jgi:hypothetical protein